MDLARLLKPYREFILAKKVNISDQANWGPRSRVCAREALCSAPYHTQNCFFLGGGRGSLKLFFYWNPIIFVF